MWQATCIVVPVNKAKAFELETFFQALADRTRLRLLNLMSEREVCVCYFVEVLDQPQSKISRHLAYLRACGLVAPRRDGKWMHYSIVMPPHAGASRLLRQTMDALKQERFAQKDLARFKKACCSPDSFSGLAGAPRPIIGSGCAVAA